MKTRILAAVAAVMLCQTVSAQQVGFFDAGGEKAAEAGGYCHMDLVYQIDRPQASTIIYGGLDCAPTAEKAMANILARATAPRACESVPRIQPRPKAAAGTCLATIVHPVGDPSEPRIVFDNDTCRPGAPIAMATLVTFLLAHPNPGQQP